MESSSSSLYFPRTKSLPNPNFNGIKPVRYCHSFPNAGSSSSSSSSTTPSEYKYESLKEILGSPSSPKGPLITCSCGTDDIPIRNRLVQKAAWSYLQPAMPAIKTPSQKCFFLLLWERLSHELKRPIKFVNQIIGLFAAAGVRRYN
ncbi:uncharacterized protein [Nicotiana tomentosiformis]|uniref:uncharacterized protein n=1 Tax=Nicotiana tomentosiformis TaxID=4098 RepID=UPI00051B66E4|nr:uncharacterized protein LOC104115078 [Nicotiana tomentosiformis]